METVIDDLIGLQAQFTYYPYQSLKIRAGIVFPVLILRNRIRAKWKIEGLNVIVTLFEKLLKKDEKSISSSFKRIYGKKITITYQLD